MTRPGPQRSVVIHGHFYQPPREDPWLDQVEREPNAAPYHDWNERIDQECYRAVLAARSLPGRGEVALDGGFSSSADSARGEDNHPRR